MTIVGDNPIRRKEDDVLGRAELVQSFVTQVLSLDASEGLVVGVLGGWGSGKTSFINLARPVFEDADIPVLDFNPWMFSGAEQLVESFFIELSAQLKVKPGLEEIGEKLESYGDVFAGIEWLPAVGSIIKSGRTATKAIGKILQQKKEGTGTRRKKLEKALKSLDKPVVVVIDDIDRLTPTEVGDIFKLIRLTASFPNLVYLVAFDRERVEQSLEEKNFPGRAYLEKIVQTSIHLPMISNDILTRQVTEAIYDVLKDMDNPGPFSEANWPNVFVEIISPLIQNMRDVRRYTAAIHLTVSSLNGRIELVDILGLEAVRMFLPDVFTQLPDLTSALTTHSSSAAGNLDAHYKNQIRDFVSGAGKNKGLVATMIQHLFPAAERHVGGSSYANSFVQEWEIDRRVANEGHLRFYLERRPTRQLSISADAEKAFALMSNRSEFKRYLLSLDRDRLEDVVDALRGFARSATPDQVVPGVIVLLNILSRIPDRPRGLLDLGPYFLVGGLVLRLLENLPSKEAVEQAVNEIRPQLELLSSEHHLLTIAGYRENAGHKLISKTAYREFEGERRAELREKLSTGEVDYEKEYDLFRVIIQTNREAPSDEETIEVPDDPKATLAVLRTAITEDRRSGMDEGTGQPIGEVYVTKKLYIPEVLELYGNDVDELRERIDKLKEAGLPDSEDVINVAERELNQYLASENGDSNDE